MKESYFIVILFVGLKVYQHLLLNAFIIFARTCIVISSLKVHGRTTKEEIINNIVQKRPWSRVP